LPDASEPVATTPVAKARGKHAPLPTELPRIEIVHDVAESDRTCPCGTLMAEIGQDVSELLWTHRSRQ